jgi:hypothetical protein
MIIYKKILKKIKKTNFYIEFVFCEEIVMPTYTTTYDIAYFTNAISIAEKLIRDLKRDDIREKLETIRMLNELPKLPRDEESKSLKIYKPANEVYKKLYIEVARAIMFIIDSNYGGVHDKSESYNYAFPKEPVEAAEAIKLLPNAFVGGPIKSAVNSNYPQVQGIAIEYFETLPGDVRVSDIFPKGFGITLKKLKAKLYSR